MQMIQFAGFLEEQTIAGHRIVSTGPCENQSVVTSKGRDHDRHRHDCRATSGKDRINSR